MRKNRMKKILVCVLLLIFYSVQKLNLYWHIQHNVLFL